MNNQNNSFMNEEPLEEPASAPVPPSWSTGVESVPANNVDGLQPQGSSEMPVGPTNNPVGIDPAQSGEVPLDQMGFYQTPPTANGQGSGKMWIIVTVIIILLAAGGFGFAYSKGWIGSVKKPTPVVQDNTIVEPITPEIITPKPNPVATAAGRDNTRKTDIQNIKTQLKVYYQQNQAYPVVVSQKVNDPNTVLSVLIPSYLESLPLDPLSPTYYYNYKSDGKTFELSSILEIKTDLSGKKVGNFFLYIVTDVSVETPVSPIGSSTGSTLSFPDGTTSTTGTTLTTGSTTTTDSTTTSGTTVPTSSTSSSSTQPVTTTSLPTSTGN